MIGTLATLVDADVTTEPLGALGLLATSEVLWDIHTEVVRAAGVDAQEEEFQLVDSGVLEAQTGRIAQEHHAHRMAVDHYARAADIARRYGMRFELANRLAGLAASYRALGDTAAHTALLDELRGLADGGDLSLRGELVARRALGTAVADTDPDTAITELSVAANCGEELRLRLPSGTRRANVVRDFSDIYHRLADLFRRTNKPTTAFEALQRAKGRRYLDAREHAAGDKPHVPMSLAETRELLATAYPDRPTVLVDFDTSADGVTAYVVDSDELRVVHVAGDFAAVAGTGTRDIHQREIELVETCRDSPLLAKLASSVDEAIPAGARTLLVPDGYLHNLPLHTIPIMGTPWCERTSIGYLPAAAAMRDRADATNGGCFVAGDSRGDLPGAAGECRAVGTLYGTKALLGNDCTLAAATEVLTNDLDIVHLAVHGRGDTRRGGRASLLFADGKGGQEWVPFETLAELSWRTRLVIFSGCGTGIVGPQHGSELVGVARAAAEAGAASVIATLWPVDDEMAGRFMIEFHAELCRRWRLGTVDLLATLDMARHVVRARLPAAMGDRRRDGRDVPPEDTLPVRPQVTGTTGELLLWGPFVLFGDPLLRRPA